MPMVLWDFDFVVLLFDTPRLAQADSTIDTRSPELFTAVRRLLEIIRHLANVDDGMKHMVSCQIFSIGT